MKVPALLRLRGCYDAELPTESQVEIVPWEGTEISSFLSWQPQSIGHLVEAVGQTRLYTGNTWTVSLLLL